MKWLARGGVLVLGGALLAGCTLVPTSAQPVAAPRGDIPFGLLNPTIPGTKGGRVTFEAAQIELVSPGRRLVATTRLVPSPAQFATVLDQLLRGPNATERARGLRSDLPGEGDLLGVDVEGATVALNFRVDIGRNGLANEERALAQLVGTAAPLGVSSLTILYNGVIQSLPLPNGQRRISVTAAEFAGLLR